MLLPQSGIFELTLPLSHACPKKAIAASLNAAATQDATTLVKLILLLISDCVRRAARNVTQKTVLRSRHERTCLAGIVLTTEFPRISIHFVWLPPPSCRVPAATAFELNRYRI